MTMQEEINKLHERHHTEWLELLDTKHTKKDRHKMATRHVKEFVILVKQEINKELEDKK